MKRSKSLGNITKHYDDTISIIIPEAERKRMMDEFLAAGGMVYKATGKRGRIKGKMSRKEVTAYNKKISEQIKKNK